MMIKCKYICDRGGLSMLNGEKKRGTVSMILIHSSTYCRILVKKLV